MRWQWLTVLIAAAAMAGCGGSGSTGSASDAAPAIGSEPAPPPAVTDTTRVASEESTQARAVEPPVVEAADEGGALWISRDRGQQVILSAAVEPGVTVIQALGAVADIETAFGGRFVQSIEGIEGDLTGQSDWFYLVNGIEPDVGAAELKVREGDTIWWDYRSWIDSASHPAAVVGAFPEPFRNGWKGSTRPVEVHAPPELAEAASALDGLIGRAGEGDPHVFELVIDDGAVGATLTASMGNRNGSPVTFTLRGAASAVEGAALALADTPSLVRFRYEARFDEQGNLVQ